MKKIILILSVIIIIIAASFYIRNTPKSNSAEALALIENTKIHKDYIGIGAVPQSFFKLDLGGEQGEEIFGSYKMGNENEGEGFVKTAFVVFANYSGEWVEIAHDDFLGSANIFMRKEKGRDVLIASVKLSNERNRETSITIKKLPKKGYGGFYYQIDSGF